MRLHIITMPMNIFLLVIECHEKLLLLHIHNFRDIRKFSSEMIQLASYFIFFLLYLLFIATFANVMHLIMALTLNLKIRASNFLVSVFYLATKTFSFKYQFFFREVMYHNTNPFDFSIESQIGIT